ARGFTSRSPSCRVFTYTTLCRSERQHRPTESLTAMEGVGGGGNSPTFEEIRNKIESRYTTALGKQELAEATGASSSAQLDAAALTRESEGRSKLEQIRASMGLESGGAAGAGRQLTEGKDDDTATATTDAQPADTGGTGSADTDGGGTDGAGTNGAGTGSADTNG